MASSVFLLLNLEIVPFNLQLYIGNNDIISRPVLVPIGFYRFTVLHNWNGVCLLESVKYVNTPCTQNVST